MFARREGGVYFDMPGVNRQAVCWMGREGVFSLLLSGRSGTFNYKQPTRTSLVVIISIQDIPLNVSLFFHSPVFFSLIFIGCFFKVFQRQVFKVLRGFNLMRHRPIIDILHTYRMSWICVSTCCGPLGNSNNPFADKIFLPCQSSTWLEW